MLPSTSRVRIHRFLILLLLTALLTSFNQPAHASSSDTAQLADSPAYLKLGCSTTPHDGSLCLTIENNGRIDIDRYSSPGAWLEATRDEGSDLLVGGTGYQFPYVTGIIPTLINHFLTGDTIYTVFDAGGLIFTQAVTYKDGDDGITYKWSIHNPDAYAAANVRFIHSTFTKSIFTPNLDQPTWNGSDTIGVTHSSEISRGWTMTLQGFTPPDAYESGNSGTTQEHISQFALTNTLTVSSWHVYALQWNRAVLAGGETWEISAREKTDYTASGMGLYVTRYQRIAGSDGKITSSPPGIDCGPSSSSSEACSSVFATGSTIQLSVTPDPGSVFAGWQDSAGNIISKDNPLSVTMATSKSFSAVFAQKTVDVTFTLTDGGAHAGMPLPGTVEVRNLGYYDNYYQLDPFTGKVTASLDQNLELIIIARSSGYITQYRTVKYSSPTASEAFALLPDPASGCPIGYQKSASTTPITLLNEPFETGGSSLPAGWSQTTYRDPEPGPAAGWTVASPGYTGSSSAFHDTVNISGTLFMDTLLTPPIHIPANATLTFYQKSKLLSQYQTRIVSLVDPIFPSGENVLSSAIKPTQEDTWQKVSISLASYGGKDYSIGFHYEAPNAPSGDQWFIDDVKIEGVQAACEPLSGGRVTGYVTSALTTGPIPSAKVTSGGSTFTVPANSLTGLYYLWLPAGSNQAITASATGYFSQSATPTVTANAVTRQDLALETSYTFTTLVTGKGSGLVSTDKAGPYHLGEIVQLTATPGAGSRFDGWVGSGINASNRFTTPLLLPISGNMGIVADFELNPVSVTFTLTDGAAHAGTPLFGTIYVSRHDGYGTTAYSTDPFTGQVTLPLYQGITYYFTVTAPGYAAQLLTKSYTVATANEAFALLPDPALGCPSGYQYSKLGTQVVLNEGFESGIFPPTAWGQSYRWKTSSAARSGSYAAFHDTYSGFGVDYLRTPRIHIPANATLSFYQKVDLRQDIYNGNHHVYVSDGSNIWNGSEQGIGIVAPPSVQNTWGQVTYDLSAYAGQDLYIAFFHASSGPDSSNDDQWWLDDIRLEGDSGTCTALSGGRVVGYITDSVSAALLSGAAVSGAAAPAAPDSTGLYQLWAPPGDTLLTASAPGHADRSATVTIPAGAATVTRQDFALTPVFILTTHVTGSGSIEARVNGSLDPGPYPSGAQVTLTAIPAPHNHFVEWENHSNNPTRMITVTADLDVTAVFAADPTYTLTTHVGGSGSIEARVNGSLDPGPYPSGTQVTLTALPAAGSHFFEWEDHSTNPIRTVTVTANLDVTAVFACNPIYTLTTHFSGRGSIEARVGSVLNPGPYCSGDQVTLTAVPDVHYHFTGWENSSTKPIRVLTITSNLNVTAVFSPDTFPITPHVVGDGVIEARVNGSPFPGPYPYGLQVTLTAIPGEHSHFVKWENDATDLSRTVTVTGSLDVTATFATNTYTLTSHTAGSGSGSIEILVNGAADPGPYPYGTQVTLRAVPAAGSSFTRWENNDPGSERTLTITGDLDLTGTFTLNLVQSDLSVVMARAFPAPGGIRYTILVTNLGPDPADGAQIEDIFGSGLGKTSWTCAADFGAACPAPGGSGSLNATIPSLPSGGHLTFTVDAVLINGSGLENSVTVTAPGTDPDPANNTASAWAYRIYLPSINNR